MNNIAYNLEEYLINIGSHQEKDDIMNAIDQKIEATNNILKFNKEELKEYKVLLKTFEDTNSSSSSSTEKGEALEDLVTFIINKSAVFEVYKNIRTSSNEIDMLVRFNKKGVYLNKNGLFLFEPNFLCECKNYNRSVSVTWTGKFYSLAKVTKNSLGILFSYHGLSGKEWSDSIGLTKKIYLADEKNTKIIDFNIDDFKKLAEGKHFIDLINDKIFNLQNDVNINHLISEHPNENSVRNV